MDKCSICKTHQAIYNKENHKEKPICALCKDKMREGREWFIRFEDLNENKPPCYCEYCYKVVELDDCIVTGGRHKLRLRCISCDERMKERGPIYRRLKKELKISIDQIPKELFELEFLLIKTKNKLKNLNK